MSTQVENANVNESNVESSTVNMLSFLTSAQQDALAAKFAKLPKNLKKDVRALQIEGSEAEQYAVYILAKMANDYTNAQNRDIWVQRLEMLIPRLNTKDEKLKAQTDKQVALIALEIEDIDQRADIQTLLKKNMLPKSTDAYNLLQCFERLEELFKSAWKS